MTADANEIIKELGEAYLAFQSYQDTGYSETLWDPGTDKERLVGLTFSTIFKRPNFFRFEWRDRHPFKDAPEKIAVIWCDGKHSYSKYSFLKKQRRNENLGLTVAGATGVSSASAHTVSALLMKEVRGRKLTDLTNLSYLGSESLNNEDCHILRCTSERRTEDVTDFWISKSRSILLRIERDYVLELGGAAERLKKDRFKSVRSFIRWFRCRRDMTGSVKRNAVLKQSTHYQNVIINAAIATDSFSLAGPAIS